MKNRQDNKGRTFQAGEGQWKNGRYVFTYRDIGGKQQKAYSWTLLPSDRWPKDKKPDLCLRDKEKKIRADLHDNISIKGSKQTVFALCSSYVKTHSKNKRENTLANYKTALNILKNDSFGRLAISDINQEIAISFLQDLQDNKNYRYSSIQNVRGVLRPAFEWALDQGYIRRNPFSFQLKNAITNDTVHRDALTADELALFLDWVKNDAHYHIYYDMFYLQFHTGLRVSELCGLTIDDINFAAHFINVERQLMRTRKMQLYIEKPKTISGSRKVPITPDVEACLWHILDNRPVFDNEIVITSLDPNQTMRASGFLFFDKNNTPVVAQTVENHYRWAEAKFKREVKNATDKKISSHVARHTFCTLRVKEGMQPVTLQKIMGHNSIRTTLGWYTHLEEGDIITEALELMKNDNSVMKYEG